MTGLVGAGVCGDGSGRVGDTMHKTYAINEHQAASVESKDHSSAVEALVVHSFDI